MNAILSGFDSCLPNLLPLTRRDMLCRSGMGFASLGLAGLLAEQNSLLTPPSADGGYGKPMLARMPHFPGKVKHVIHLFMNGGPSHVDTFDPKPSLETFAGKNLPNENLRTERKTGAAFPSPYKFKKYGQSGIEASEIFSHVADSADDLSV